MRRDARFAAMVLREPPGHWRPIAGAPRRREAPNDPGGLAARPLPAPPLERAPGARDGVPSTRDYT
eukprot:6445519-Pyramimonas_sp.AAC.1